LTSIGTLFAFIVVSLGIMVLRKADPNIKRPFRTPLVPLVPILAVIVCSAMIIGLDHFTQLTALAWMLIGFVVYFLYSRNASKLNA
jgi:APA family basic amino acid/polyamine antiporter